MIRILYHSYMARPFKRRAGPPSVITDGCIECGICERVCPYDAIFMSDDFEFVVAASSARVATGATTRARSTSSSRWTTTGREGPTFEPAFVYHDWSATTGSPTGGTTIMKLHENRPSPPTPE